MPRNGRSPGRSISSALPSKTVSDAAIECRGAVSVVVHSTPPGRAAKQWAPASLVSAATIEIGEIPRVSGQSRKVAVRILNRGSDSADVRALTVPAGCSDAPRADAIAR